MRLHRLNLKDGSCLEVQGQSVCGFRQVQTPFSKHCKTLDEISDEPLLLSVWPSAVAGFPERPAQGLVFILELGRK